MGKGAVKEKKKSCRIAGGREDKSINPEEFMWLRGWMFMGRNRGRNSAIKGHDSRRLVCSVDVYLKYREEERAKYEIIEKTKGSEQIIIINEK